MTYTTKMLAEKWQCSKKSILKLIHSGRLKAFKIGTEWRIDENEARKYIESYYQNCEVTQS